MRYDPCFFVDDDGSEPVREYIQSLPTAQRAKIHAFVDYVTEHGPQARRPLADYMGDRLGIYELRPKPHRVLYFFFHRDKVIFLHAFIKRTKEIQREDIAIALERRDKCLKYGKVSEVRDKE